MPIIANKFGHQQKKMRKIALHWQIAIGLVLAIFVGIFFPGVIKYIDWLGQLFLQALKMVVIPLIIASIITGVTNMGTGQGMGRLGIKTISYYIVTSMVAILTGLLLVNLIKPGIGANLGLTVNVEGLPSEKMTFADSLKGIIPSNIISSMAKGDVLPVIVFSLLFGYFITKLKTATRKVMETFFNGMFEVMMMITHLIIKFTPIGVFAIVSAEVVRNSQRLPEVASSLAGYMAVVVAGLLIHSFITLPLLVRFIGKANPLKHLKNMVSPLLTAFSTSSSGATLPLTMESVENKSGVSNKITSFTLPLGATINMDGTALYECVAVMFISQAYGIGLSFGQQLIVVLMALLASIGAAGIPMAGLVMMTVVLSAVNLPLEGIGLILAVDRILDMMRTSVNVWSDTCGAVIIAKSEGEQLNV
jgi:proton glutamate symport protein